MAIQSLYKSFKIYIFHDNFASVLSEKNIRNSNPSGLVEVDYCIDSYVQLITISYLFFHHTLFWQVTDIGGTGGTWLSWG